jgi:hypothetical protein
MRVSIGIGGAASGSKRDFDEQDPLRRRWNIAQITLAYNFTRLLPLPSMAAAICCDRLSRVEDRSLHCGAEHEIGEP